MFSSFCNQNLVEKVFYPQNAKWLYGGNKEEVEELQVTSNSLKYCGLMNNVLYFITNMITSSHCDKMLQKGKK